MLAQTPQDVLHVDDRVIDDTSHSDHQPGQDHRVDRGPAYIQHKPRCHQRQRDCYKADQGGTPLEEKGEENQHYEHTRDEQRTGEIVDRHIDEIR